MECDCVFQWPPLVQTNPVGFWEEIGLSNLLLEHTSSFDITRCFYRTLFSF